MGLRPEPRGCLDASQAYTRLKPHVLRRVRRCFPSLGEADLEDAYQDAWLSILRSPAEVDDLDSYLYRAAYSQGLMELRRLRRRPAESLERLDERGSSRPGSAAATGRRAMPGDRAADSPEECAENRVLADMAEELIGQLSERERTIAKLRWGWGLSRQEIATALGVSARAVKRDIERIGPKLREQAQSAVSGAWCTPKRSMITAYALGVLSSRRMAQAELHLRACPG